MRSLSLAAVVATALVATGCASHPAVDLGFGTPEGKVEVRVYGLGWGANVEVCGITPKARGGKIEVPFECVLSVDTLLAAPKPIESKPIEVLVKPLVGATQTVKKTVELDVVRQLTLIESWLGGAARGTPLPRSEKKHTKPGIAFVGLGGVRTLDAKTVGDVDIVVNRKAVNDRATGKECSYTGMTGVLHAYDLDLEAFDAHTAKKLGKTHIANDSPTCPSTNYGRIGDKNQVSSGPSERDINEWARTLKPGTANDDSDDEK